MDYEYDYVIVGAGSAGCVLANRLSAGDASVLVLEAGEPDGPREVDIPAAFPELFHSEVDWDFHTEPQSELHDRELYWPRGKVLGGSSAINAMIYIRGHPDDYDHWAALGNDGWSWADVLPAFTLAEGNDRLGGAAHGTGGSLHGIDGPLTVTDLRSPNPLSEAFVQSAAAIGLPRNEDFNDGDQTGLGFYQVTQENGRRHSAADAYLKPVLDRPNLTARTGARVTRVQFDGSQAVGVEYEHDGETRDATATREVILCGGSINSPLLLMRSGVGPADHLQSHGIDVVEALPGVGRNLQDHLNVGVVYDCTEPITLDDAGSLWDLARFFLLKRGPLTSNVAEAGGFTRSDPDLDAPDVQFHFGPAYFVRHGEGNPDEGHGFSVGAVPLQPESRGHIMLRSADPADDPIIDPCYLSDERDVAVLLEGLKRSRELAQAAPFDEYRGEEVLPGSDVQEDEELVEYIREYAETLYHPVGTCKMGDDEHAVVDDRLRVHGVQNLRVVDASVMPTITRGNTNAPTMMIAERAAEFIDAESV